MYHGPKGVASPPEPRSLCPPTRFVGYTGSDSPAALRRLGGLLASLLSDARRLDVPNASHLMHLQNPAAFNVGLLEFLEKAS